MTDLAQWHAPLTDLFPRAEAAEEGRWRLSDEQVSRFERDGYLAGIPMLDERQVDALRADVDAVFEPGHAGQQYWYEYRANASTEPGLRLLHGSGQWRVRPAFHDLLWHQAVTAPARQILGGPVRLLHDQLFCKPARHGGIVAWHQDYSYWTYAQPMSHLTVWIALDDATEENGCLHYVPGSHRWGLLPITGLTEDMSSIHAVLTPEQERAFKPVPIPVRKGEATLHHPLMVHGSYANRSDRPRRATVVNVMREGARAAVEQPTVGGVPAWLVGSTVGVPTYRVEAEPTGPLLGGRYFPLL